MTHPIEVYYPETKYNDSSNDTCEDVQIFNTAPNLNVSFANITGYKTFLNGK